MQERTTIAIEGQSQKIIDLIKEKHSRLTTIFKQSSDYSDFEKKLSEWAKEILSEGEAGTDYYEEKKTGKAVFDRLRWQDFAAIRILDYIDNTGREVEDKNLRGEAITNEPIKILYRALKNGTGGGKVAFFLDMLYLFDQLEHSQQHSLPERAQIEDWMKRHPSGLDQEIIQLREQNRDRILNKIIQKIDSGEINDRKYYFEDAKASHEDKLAIARKWWSERLFHLRFAFRTPKTINEMLGYSLSDETMHTLMEAQEAGIPFFVNPYYLSLLNTQSIDGYIAADQPIRDYIIYSRQLIDEFGHIEAWEKEDLVKPGKPNAAGWLLPDGHNIHRRYPEVAIMIPDSMGRACGGLCASCQRMYDFQSGHLNFDLDKLK
ncbi:MAG: KamA family protein, partial [Bacteroidales bacterium]|nr:KamA family protein [Bacteroidales bacterium]